MLALLYSEANPFLVALTPIVLVYLIWQNRHASEKVAKRVETVRVDTAKAAKDAAAEVASTLLTQTKKDKKDLDEKLEVIRVDVNSNLTKALKEIEELKARLGITEENPEGDR